jgi:Protein of unknown function (DUF3152)
MLTERAEIPDPSLAVHHTGSWMGKRWLPVVAVAATAIGYVGVGRMLPGWVRSASVRHRDPESFASPSPATIAVGEPTPASAGTEGKVAVPTSASGELVVVPGRAPAPPDSEKVYQYTVEVEGGLPFDPQETAAFVHETLNDPRGWGHGDQLGFARTDSESAADFYVTLASPTMTDRYCGASGLNTRGRFSCFAASSNRPMLNARGWGQGIDAYGSDLTVYRQYMIMHEVGHRLGHGHVHCPGPGQLAPTMLQQSKALEGCVPNPWPYPVGDTLVTGPPAM